MPDKLYRRFDFKLTLLLTIIVIFASGFIYAVYLTRIKEIKFVEKNYIWEIGVYTGTSPFNLRPATGISNPVLTARDVTDVNANFVADPFVVKEENLWYIFFEVFNVQDDRGEIAFASSLDGLHWKYEQVILKEPFHLSYPFVFKWQGEYYMIPESARALELRLYKAVDFPRSWAFVKVLMKGFYLDPTLFFHDNKLWLFAQTNPRSNDRLSLYFADDLFGPWQEHPQSPILNGDARYARPAGKIFKFDGRLFRVSQDCSTFYGEEVYAFEILELTASVYREKKASQDPLITASGKGWNALGMHTVNAYQLDNGQWLWVVDGCRLKLKYKLK